MKHSVAGNTCTEIITADLIEDRDLSLIEVACIHGFRWFEGPPVESRGWRPRTSRPKLCSCGCGQALPGTAMPTQRYVPGHAKGGWRSSKRPTFGDRWQPRRAEVARVFEESTTSAGAANRLGVSRSYIRKIAAALGLALPRTSRDLQRKVHAVAMGNLRRQA